MNLIAPTKSGMNLYESVKEVAEQLRAMAFKYDVPVVSATQISRQFFNTVSPGMEGISESIGVAATSDLMCSIWQSDEDRELGVINMGIQKNRFGPNFGQAAFKCNYNTLTLKETNRDYFESDEGGEDSVEKADNALTLLSEDKPTNK
jgi:replicative DNA helicase